MNHIIIEGLDRVGKDTLIQNLCNTAQNYMVRHFSKPIGETNEEKIEYQKSDFHSEFILSLTRESIHKYPNDLYIWNRAHIGEYVYGRMYRDYDPSWIFDLETKMDFDKDDSIYLILLYADADFLIQREDGESLSDKLEDRIQEINLFKEAIDKSHIKNKLIIKVNEGNNYKPKDDILNEVLSFIKQDYNEGKTSI